jgi:hemerythrin-like domain-containing protein
VKFDTDIDRRTGWPDELRVLLVKYPRQSWQQTATPLAQFWLDRHDFFRGECSVLESAANEYNEQRILPADLAARVARRLQPFLLHLRGHHQLEDYHYFPMFRAADKRLNFGFDVLAADHELLHEDIAIITETMNALINTIRGPGEHWSDEQRRAGDSFVAASECVCHRLSRHLEDEEDLIIPILLAHGT